MTLSVHRRRDRARCNHARVWLDNIEVTKRCYYADGRRHVVRLYLHDDQGRKYLDPVTRKPATEERRGTVRIRV